MQLFPFQQEDVDHVSAILNTPPHRAAIFSEMGVGKSVEALALAIKVAKKRVLIICPAFLRGNWLNEIRKHCPGEQHFFITNYEQLHKVTNLKEYDFVIVDECQYAKNPTAQRTKHTINIVKSVKYCVLLSGTPASKGIIDMYVPCMLLSPKYADASYYKFCYRYSNPTRIKVGGREITQFKGVNQKNLPEIRAMQRQYTIRRLTKDVLTLPEMRDIFVKVTTVTNDLETQDIASLFQAALEANNFPDHIMAYKRLNALVKAEATAQYAATTDEPLLIFSDHIEPAHAIYEAVASGRKALVTGAVPPDVRQGIVDRFQKGEIDVIVATIPSLAEGVTLTRATRVIFNDCNYSPTKMAQAKKRIHRIGQENACQCVYIVSSDIDMGILRTLEAKMNEIKQFISE